MKTALSIIGIVFLVLLAVGGVFIAFLIYEGSKLDSTSQAYVDACVPAIVSNWSKDELEKRESPQLKKVAPDDVITKVFSKFSALGPMKSYDGATGQANMNVSPTKGLEITAKYTAKATFQNGKAEIQVSLVQVDGQWEIFRFHVDLPSSN